MKEEEEGLRVLSFNIFREKCKTYWKDKMTERDMDYEAMRFVVEKAKDWQDMLDFVKA